MNQIILMLFNGLSASSIILLTSLGLAVTFGLMGVINMAHGEFIMIGAYTTYMVHELFRFFLPGAVFDLYYLAAIPAAFFIAFVLGMVLEKLIVSRLYGREIDSLLATWGVSIVLQQAVRNIFGSQGVAVGSPGFLSGGLKLGRIVFSYNRIFIIGLVLLCLLLVWLLMYRSGFGSQMRATMQNRAMAQSLGINTRRIDSITFACGSGLAGIAGCTIALLGSVDSTAGQNYIVNSFMAVVLGGVGKLLGTFLGSNMIGFAGVFAENYTSSSIAKAIVLLIVIVFLQKRPKGLFVVRSRGLEE